MEYQGTVKNGVVVLENGEGLPEGAKVRVLPVEEPPTWAEVFSDVSGKAVGLPSDMARNHDHYLHGLPMPTLAERFQAVIGKAVGLAGDLAENHDYYLHGLPKKS